MAKKNLRLYRSISDAKMLAEAQTILDLLKTDMAQFTAMDAQLNAGFADDMQISINNAIKIPSDAAVLRNITELTDDQKKAWQACKDHFKDAQYFIEKAFGDNKARLQRFGFDDYREMCRNKRKVDMFMYLFDSACRQHAAALIAVGYSQQRIDAIEPLHQAFANAKRVLHNAQSESGELTDERIKIYNAVWEYLRTINRASKIVFKNNYAKQKQYLLPAGTKSNQAKKLSIV